MIVAGLLALLSLGSVVLTLQLMRKDRHLFPALCCFFGTAALLYYVGNLASPAEIPPPVQVIIAAVACGIWWLVFKLGQGGRLL